MVKVIVIDEQPLLPKWLFEDLSNQEYHISWTANVDDISEDIKTFMPDIILLDIHLEGFERWDILHRIKLEFPSIPILIVSSYDNLAHDSRLAEADGYITKDIYTKEVENKMKELCTPINFEP